MEEYQYAAIIASAIIALEMIDHFGHVLFDQHIDWLGNLANKSLKVMLFTKNFRMASTGKRNYTFAQVLNLINNESVKIWSALMTINDIVFIPFEIAYCAFFIYYYLGWSILSGLALWLLKFAALRFFKRDNLEVQTQMSALRDSRL